MMAMVLPWWRDRSRREQWLIGVMVGMFAILGISFAVVRPLAEARAAAEARLTAATVGRADVMKMTAAIRAAEARAAPTRATPLVEQVSERATAAGLTIETMQSTGDGRVTLRVAAVRPPAILRWIGEIEARDGIIVDRAAMTPNNDATIAVDLTLRSGRG